MDRPCPTADRLCLKRKAEAIMAPVKKAKRRDAHDNRAYVYSCPHVTVRRCRLNHEINVESACN